jgi:Right handed beta helix region
MVRNGHGTSTRTAPPWRLVAIGAAVVLVVGLLAVAIWMATGGSPTAEPAPAPRSVYVNPGGSDSNDGSEATPFQTIQAALEGATPGTTINLAPGSYYEELATVRDGLPNAPITIKGPESGKDRAGRYQATVYAASRAVNIDNNYYVLDGFTVDGQENLRNTPYPTDLNTIDAFKASVQAQVSDSRLIYLGSADDVRDVTGVTIRNMFLNGAGGECVRLRNNSHGNTITDSVIQYCGMYGKGEGDEDRTEFHNGEGVYIGTSPKSDDQPMYENDGSSNNIISNNIIRTFGSECLNVKENAHDNVFEGNTCSDNAEAIDFEGSNVELRGHGNIVRGNVISDSAGYSVKIQSDEDQYDKGGNAVQNNRIQASAAEPLKIKSSATQGPICGNVMSAVDDQLIETEDYTGDPTAPCPDGGSAPGPS